MKIRMVYMIIRSMKLMHKVKVYTPEKHQIYPTWEG